MTKALSYDFFVVIHLLGNLIFDYLIYAGGGRTAFW
jgi:hypothetical protein